MENNLITEELLRIKSLIRHKPGQILNEGFVNQLGRESGKYIQVEAIFPPGKSDVNNMTDQSKKDFENAVAMVIEFMTKNPKKYIARVEVTAGESVIPGPPKGKLADARANTVLKYINQYLNNNITNKVQQTIKPQIIDAKTTVDKDFNWNEYFSWVKSDDITKGKNPKNEEFKKLKSGFDKDQFNKVTIYVDEDLGDAQCLLGAIIRVMYSTDLGHHCDNAVFAIFLNGIMLTRNGLSMTTGTWDDPINNKNYASKYDSSYKKYAVLNNGSGDEDPYLNSYGGFRFNKFKLGIGDNNIDLIKKISEVSKTNGGKIIVESQCMLRYGCHQDAFHITVSDASGNVVANTYGSGGIVQSGRKVECELDSCLKLISDVKGASKSSDVAKGAASPEGKTYNYEFPTFNTLTNQQHINNLINSGSIVQKDIKNNSYIVMKDITNTINGETKKYPAGSILIINPNVVNKK